MARCPLVLLATACLLALSCLATAQRPPSPLPPPLTLFVRDLRPFPTFTTAFSIPICDPRLSNGVAFGVKKSGKAAVLSYKFSPNYFNDGAQFSFAVFTDITLDAGTGLLQLGAYGAKLSFDLAKLQPADNLQNINRCRDRKTTKLANNLFVYSYADKKSTPVLPNGNAVIDSALNTLIAAAKQFATPQPQCGNPVPKNGDKRLLLWASWLAKVQKFVREPVTCN